MPNLEPSAIDGHELPVIDLHVLIRQPSIARIQ
jgi:hypothetical protein